MIRRPPRSTRVRSSAASDVYKRQDTEVLVALLDLLDRARRRDPGLGGDATHAQANPAERRFALDADDLRAELCGADRGRIAARSASKDSDVTFHGSPSFCSLTLRS